MKNYNSNDKSKYHLLYMDANNLYGWAIVQKLPYYELRFEMNKSDFKNCIKEVNRLSLMYVVILALKKCY